jgi:hypothetical protein
MFLLIKKAKEKEISCKKESFKKHGKTVEYFSGVEQYFTNINEYAKNKRAIKIISNSDSCIFFRHDDLLQFAYAICTSIIVFFFSYAMKWMKFYPICFY